MFSYYIQLNAVLIGTARAPSNKEVAAFKETDGGIAVAMINSGSSTERVVAFFGRSVYNGREPVKTRDM
jgi:hypothetical protein